MRPPILITAVLLACACVPATHAQSRDCDADNVAECSAGCATGRDGTTECAIGRDGTTECATECATGHAIALAADHATGQATECATDRDCDAEFWCDDTLYDGDSSSHMCERRLDIGQTCGSDRQCRTGLICTSEYLYPGACSDRQQGNHCDNSERHCADGLYCDLYPASLDGDEQSNACEVKRQRGERCADDIQCASGRCRRGRCRWTI